MSTAITLAGEALIAQKHISGKPLVIDRIILANLPGLDLAQPVNREQGKPATDKIVHEYVIPDDFKGFVNPNQVVYSMLLGSEVGNFQFNWLGLYSSADNTLIAVTELSSTEKWQSNPATNKLGNVLTRNFLLQFSGAKAVTNITVEAKTWQVDFTARLRSIDERERVSNRDIFGRSCFFNDGFKVFKYSGNYKLKAGVGYVEGIRCVLGADKQLTVSALPKNVFIDVSLQQQGSDVVPVIVPVITDSKADYTDANNTKHYLVQTGYISAAGVVTDVRRTEGIDTDVIEYLKHRTDTHAARTDDPHKTMDKISALKDSSITSSSTSRLATPKAVKTVQDNLNAHNANAKAHRLATEGQTGFVRFATAEEHKAKTAQNIACTPRGVWQLLLSIRYDSVNFDSSYGFATSKAVKTVMDALNGHKAANDPHGVVAKVKALLSSSITSTSTTTFATPKAVKLVRDLIVGHTNNAEAHSAGIHGGIELFDGAVNSSGRPIDAKTRQADLKYGVCDGRTYTAPDGRKVTTPDMRDRFPVGAGGKYAVGDTGGAERVTLIEDQNAPHIHEVQVRGTNAFDNTSGRYITGQDVGISGSNVGKTESSGGGQSHENRPPYYGVFFIKRL